LAVQTLLLGRDKDSTAEPATHSPTAEVERLVTRLHGRNALAPTLLLRAVCVVDLNFFEAGLAAMAGIPSTTRAL